MTKIGDIVLYDPVAIGKCAEKDWIEGEKFYGVVVAHDEANTGWSWVSYRTVSLGTTRYFQQAFPNASLVILANVADFGLEMP